MATTLEHPWAHFCGRVLLALHVQRDAGARSLLLELGRDLVKHRQDRLGAERDDAGARFELGQEEHLVDQLADLVDLGARALDEVGDVLPRQRGELEQGEQPGERGPQLVRDGRGESRAQLLVGREVARLREIDEPLRPAVDVVWHHQRPLVREQLGAQLLAFSHTERLSRAAAGRDDDPACVEHDDGLAALFQQHLAAHGVCIHHSVTTPSPLDSPPRLHDARVAKC